MAERKRYIVLAGFARAVTDLCRDRGLSQAEVIAVTPSLAQTALRGRVGHFGVLTHESWARVDVSIQSYVAQQIAMISAGNTNG
jgi:hypothetical protein